MSPTRTPTAGGRAAVTLAAAALLLGLPAAAADSPEAAVDQLVEIVGSGDFAALEQVVCESEVDAFRDQFDIATSLGISDDGAAGAALAYRIEDPATEVIDQTDDSALVRLTGTLRVEVDEDAIRDVVRQMLENEGATADDQRIDEMASSFLGLFDMPLPMDEELELVLEDGDWLVCGGIDTEPEDPAAVEPSVSFEGLCGLVPLTEINAVGEPDLAFDSSGGSGEYCTFSSTTDAQFLNLTVTFARAGSIDDYRSFLPDGTDLTVAGLPAYAPEGQLLVEVADGILQVSAYLGEEPPEDLDAVAYLSAIAELYLPVLPQFGDAGGDPGDGGTGSEPEAAFCDILTVEQLNELTGLAFDETSGGPTFCSYSSTDPESFYLLSTSLDSIELDDFKIFVPDGEELTVADLPAYSISGGQLWVGIPESGSTLSVTAFIEAALGGEGADSDEVALAVAEQIIPTLLAEHASEGDGG